PGVDPCNQSSCSHEVAFYHGPTVGPIKYNTQIDIHHYLDFHFAGDPVIAQDEMTPCNGACYALGDGYASATSMAYPKDLGGYVKDFNVASWLPPQTFQDPSPNGCR